MSSKFSTGSAVPKAGTQLAVFKRPGSPNKAVRKLSVRQRSRVMAENGDIEAPPATGAPAAESTEQSHKKRVCVVGGGCAGMAAAWSLSRFPEKFDVEVWESLPVPGGVASSCTVTTEDGKDWAINDQVQGGAPSYRNNLLMFEEFGFKGHQINMKVCFGKGEYAWTNHSDSELVKRLQPEIERFGKLLKWVIRFEAIFVLMPIRRLLSWWRFSKDFADRMVYPLTALFFGTGNQTPNVASNVIARVFLDKELALFKYSPTRLLDGKPEMFAFPNLQEIFSTMADKMPANVRCNKPVASIERHNGGRDGITVTDTNGESSKFDEIIFACDMETVQKVLKQPHWWERKILGNVKYFNDYIVTHEDADYMEKHYQMNYDDEDMYFIRTDPDDAKKVEMSFNLSMYQPHLLDAKGDRRNIYQSIFLDDNTKNIWTHEDLDKDKILKTRWTRQFAHTWQHFASWVPFVRFLQGKEHTWYAGAVTLFNTHEIATMSGLAAADRLGAPYPFDHDPLAKSQYDLYMSIAHGINRKKQAKRCKKPVTKEEMSQDPGMPLDAPVMAAK